MHQALVGLSALIIMCTYLIGAAQLKQLHHQAERHTGQAAPQAKLKLAIIVRRSRQVGGVAALTIVGAMLDVVAPNAAWARRIVPQWADFASTMGSGSASPEFLIGGAPRGGS